MIFFAGNCLHGIQNKGQRIELFKGICKMDKLEFRSEFFYINILQ